MQEIKLNENKIFLSRLQGKLPFLVILWKKFIFDILLFNQYFVIWVMQFLYLTHILLGPAHVSLFKTKANVSCLFNIV